MTGGTRVCPPCVGKRRRVKLANQIHTLGSNALNAARVWLERDDSSGRSSDLTKPHRILSEVSAYLDESLHAQSPNEFVDVHFKAI